MYSDSAQQFFTFVVSGCDCQLGEENPSIVEVEVNSSLRLAQQNRKHRKQVPHNLDIDAELAVQPYAYPKTSSSYEH